MAFQDHFSGHADLYRAARPTYPGALFDWLAQRAPARDLAWDCACGSGQASVALSRRFARTVGTDASAAQVANAIAAPGLEYRVEPAEATSFTDASVDLVTVAQALHWFDRDRFYAEVRRVVRPGGLVAAFTYADCAVDADIVAAKDRLYVDLVGEFWPPERDIVEDRYRSVEFPFDELAPPQIPLVVPWTVDQYLAYARSWSATQRFIAERGEDPVALVEPELRAAWGPQPREVRWDLAMRVGRV